MGALLLVGSFGLPAAATPEDPTVFYPSRYHPDSPDRGGATAIHLERGMTSPNLLLSLPASGGSITVRVLSEERRLPVAGILVEACAGRLRAIARTAWDGRATVTGVPAGRVTVRTRPDDPRSETGAYGIRHAPGVAEQSRALQLTVANNEVTDFGVLTVPEAARLTAQVLQPVGGAWEGLPVVLRAADGAVRRTMTSGPDGRVRFGGLEPGDYLLWVDAHGTYAITEAWDGTRDTLSSVSIRLARGEVRPEIILTPDIGGRIDGVIRDSESNNGLAGVEVRVFSTGNPLNVYTFLTDELGFYVAFGLPTGSYKIFVPAIRRYFPNAREESAARVVQVVEGQEDLRSYDVAGQIEPECRMPPSSGGYIQGIVRADFIRMPSSRLLVFGDGDTIQQRLTEDGLYRVGCLESGSYRVAFVPDGVYRTQYHPKTSDPDSAVAITVTEGDTVKAIDFSPELGVAIQGTVVSASDLLPIEGVSILAVLPSTGLMAIGASDEAGVFRIDRLSDGTGLPAGDWIVGSDSLMLSRVPFSRAYTIELVAQRTKAGVAVQFWFPERASLVDWHLDRREREGTSVRIADAASHPDGLLARSHLDATAPMGELAYQIEIACEAPGQLPPCASPWVWVDRLPAQLSPQPWDGRGQIRLPGLVPEGESVHLITPGGRCITRAIARNDRVAFVDGPDLASGVYFLRWRDLSGRHRAARLVIQR